MIKLFSNRNSQNQYFAEGANSQQPTANKPMPMPIANSQRPVASYWLILIRLLNLRLKIIL